MFLNVSCTLSKKMAKNAVDMQKEERVEVVCQAKLPWSGEVPLRRRWKLVLFYSVGTEKVGGNNNAA